jgi:hypothetical protein
LASSLVIQKIPPEMVMQGIKIYGLWLTVIVIVVAPFGTAFGLAHFKPIGCPIAGAFEAGDIHKGFGQIDRVPIDLFPVSAYPLDTQ